MQDHTTLRIRQDGMEVIRRLRAGTQLGQVYRQADGQTKQINPPDPKDAVLNRTRYRFPDRPVHANGHEPAGGKRSKWGFGNTPPSPKTPSASRAFSVRKSLSQRRLWNTDSAPEAARQRIQLTAGGQCHDQKAYQQPHVCPLPAQLSLMESVCVIRRGDLQSGRYLDR